MLQIASVSMLPASIHFLQRRNDERRPPSQGGSIKSLNYVNRKREIESINDKNLKLLNTLKNTKGNIRPSEFREHERRCMQLKQNISTTHYSPAPDKALPSIRPIYQSFHSGATPYSNMPPVPPRPTSVGGGRRTQSQDMLRPFSAEGSERPFTSG